MLPLSYSQICQVSGGRGATKEELTRSVEHHSSVFTFWGGALSGIYALATNRRVSESWMDGGHVVISINYSTFPYVFLQGLGLSWLAGVTSGVGAALIKEY